MSRADEFRDKKISGCQVLGEDKTSTVAGTGSNYVYGVYF